MIHFSCSPPPSGSEVLRPPSKSETILFPGPQEVYLLPSWKSPSVHESHHCQPQGACVPEGTGKYVQGYFHLITCSNCILCMKLPNLHEMKIYCANPEVTLLREDQLLFEASQSVQDPTYPLPKHPINFYSDLTTNRRIYYFTSRLYSTYVDN